MDLQPLPQTPKEPPLFLPLTQQPPTRPEIKINVQPVIDLNTQVALAPFDINKIQPEIRNKFGDGNLAKYHYYFRDLESPEHVITWNYNYAVASCLGRKVWIGNENDFPIFGNMFLLFVGEPGTGKSLPAVKTTQVMSGLVDFRLEDNKIIEKRLINVAPQSVTLEACYESLADAHEGLKISDKPVVLYAHSSVSFCLAEEMGTLFKKDTEDLVVFLTAGWNCGDFHRKTKTCGEVFLKNMCINFLGCCTPGWYRDNMNDKLIDQGFTARVLHIYVGERRKDKPTTIVIDADQRLAMEHICKNHFRKLAKLVGSVKYTPEAYEYLDIWNKTRRDKHLNTSRKLIYYYERRKHHMQKLALVCHFHDKLNMEVDLEDMKMADRMLEAAEIDMHRALQDTNVNPLAKLSDAIYLSLRTSGAMSEKRIVAEHFGLGNEDEIPKALHFLVNQGLIEPVTLEGKAGYKASLRAPS